jgi:hypothetical protein
MYYRILPLPSSWSEPGLLSMKSGPAQLWWWLPPTSCVCVLCRHNHRHCARAAPVSSERHEPEPGWARSTRWRAFPNFRSVGGGPCRAPHAAQEPLCSPRCLRLRDKRRWQSGPYRQPWIGPPLHPGSRTRPACLHHDGPMRRPAHEPLCATSCSQSVANLVWKLDLI